MSSSDASHAKRSELAKLIGRLAGLIALPVIPFYLLSYRLMGRRCTYRWPETDVRPVDYSPVRLVGRWQESPYFLSKVITGLFVTGLALIALLVKTLS
jgi:hypothetical protein